MVEKEKKATPRPWRLFSACLETQTPILEIQDAKGKPVVKWSGFDGIDRSKRKVIANAELIVRAVNAYDELLAACRAAYDALRSYQHGNASPDLAKEVADKLSGVIAKAESDCVPRTELKKLEDAKR
jgi:hypothetical protein